MAPNLESIDNLIARARELKDAIVSDASEGDLDYALDQVSNAGSHDVAFPNVNLFEADTTTSQTDVSSEDALASIALELHAGNVLVAAGQAIPEPEAVTTADKVKQLDDALEGLERARNNVRQTASPGFRANFEADIAKQASRMTADQAPEEFRKAIENTLKGLVSDSETVATKIFTNLKAMKASDVVEAFAKFADETAVFPGATRLIRQGIEKIQSAYNKLIRLVGKDLLKAVKDKVQKAWTQFKEGKFTRVGLEEMYAVGTLLRKTDDLLKNEKLDRQSLIKACADLAPLEPKFKRHMDLLSALVSGVAFTALILPFTPLGPNSVLIAAGAYLLALGATILIGREYAGSEWTLHWVKGVGEIVRGL